MEKRGRELLSLQNLRYWASVPLLVIVFFPIIVLFFIDRPNKGTAFGIYVASVVLPSIAFIIVNLKHRAWRATGRRKVNRKPAILSMVFLFLACASILVGFIWAAWFRVDTVEQRVENFDGPVNRRTVPHPIEDGVGDIGTYFGSFLTLALSLEIFSIPFEES
jgi:NADH:ubiquinone oxidoreductase subunit 5 (subunit L)/multisubunit Na+/H+ antiporter MnhA subunit